LSHFCIYLGQNVEFKIVSKGNGSSSILHLVSLVATRAKVGAASATTMESVSDLPLDCTADGTGDPPGRAIQFVAVQNGKLHITEEGADFLRSVHFPSTLPPTD